MGREFPSSVNIKNGLLQFNNIKLSDAGRYRCTAVNSAGEADAVADVFVQGNMTLQVVFFEFIMVLSKFFLAFRSLINTSSFI